LRWEQDFFSVLWCFFSQFFWLENALIDYPPNEALIHVPFLKGGGGNLALFVCILSGLICLFCFGFLQLQYL
jgi:hypothetical protein